MTRILRRSIGTDLNLERQAPPCIQDGIVQAVTSSDTGILTVVYADVYAGKTSEKHRETGYVAPAAYESLRRHTLYFLLWQELQSSNSRQEEISASPPLLESQNEADSSSKESPRRGNREELWETLDSAVNRNWKQVFAQDMNFLQTRAADGGGEYDSLWRTFWEYYRVDTSKTTLPEVACARGCAGGRLTTQGCLPSLCDRILQESAVFEKQEHAEQAQAVKRLPLPQTPVSNAGSRNLTPRTPSRSRGGRRQSSSRPNSNSQRNQQESTGYETWGFHQDASVGSGNLRIVDENVDSMSNVSGSVPNSRGSSASSLCGTPQQLKRRPAMKVKKHGPASMNSLKLPSLPEGRQIPIDTFRSWGDYKVRCQAKCHEKLDADSKQLNRMAAAKPQVHASIALREHTRACEWQMRGEVIHPSGAMTARLAYSSSQESLCDTDGFLSARSTMTVPSSSFHRPWSREEGMLRQSQASGSHLDAIERFAKVCVHTGVHPQPASIRFLVKLPPKLDVRGAGYADEDVLALAAALPSNSMARIEAADLGESPRLTDKAVCTMLQALAARHATTLCVIKLDHCRGLRKETISLCTRLIRDSFKDMQMLDFSGILIGLQEYMELAKGVMKHTRLREIRVAETGLGMFDKSHAACVIELIVSNKQLEAVEFGWNCLDVASFETLGQGLVNHKKLASVGLANTGPTRDPVVNGSPVLVFLEFLAKDATLTSLDISNNVLNQDAMLVLESAAQRHPRLARVDVSRNPVGLSGARALLRLMAYPECPDLTKLVLHECNCGWKDYSTVGPWDVDPSGKYSLNLVQPAKRALLRLLLARLSEGSEAVAPHKIMVNARFRRDGVEAPFNFKLIRQCANHIWEVPTEGVLEFELNAFEAVCGSAVTGLEDSQASATSKIEGIVPRSRLSLTSQRQVLAVLGQVKCVSDAEERDALLEALSFDFILTPEQVEGLCKTKTKWSNCGKEPSTVCRRLLPCVLGAINIRKFFQMMPLDHMTRVSTSGRCLLCLNLENPTGHYDLDLSESSDWSAAERLLLLNRWEVHVWKSFGHPDISQHGNWKNFRNEVYGNRAFIWNAEEWHLPGGEELSFDYVSLRRPPQDAKPLSDSVWKRMVHHILSAMFQNTTPGTLRTELTAALRPVDASDNNGDNLLGSENDDAMTCANAVTISDKDVLWSLRALSSKFWLECRQIRILLCQLFSAESRREAMVFLIFRCVDWPLNSKICRSKFQDQDWRILTARMGHIAMFDFFQPEGFPIHIDLSFQDQRRTLSLYMGLAQQEPPNRISHPRIDWNGPSIAPRWETFERGIPMTYSDCELIPHSGEFEGVYHSSMDSMKLRVRRKLATTVGGWAGIPEDIWELQHCVKWWSVLDDLPTDVSVWANYCVAHYPSPSALFSACDESRDGALNHNEFSKGFQALGFRLPAEKVFKRISMQKSRQSLQSTLSNKTDESTSKPNTAAGSRPSSAEKSEKESPRKSGKKAGKTTPDAGKAAKSSDALHEVSSKLDKKVTEQESKHQSVLTSVFRFLDPNADGEVTQKEFNVLEGIWNELQHTTWEFVEHLKAQLGSLEKAWELADEDQSGSMDEQEFHELARRWHFDGPVTQIYMYLDEDGGGTIGKDEWMKLEDVHPAALLM